MNNLYIVTQKVATLHDKSHYHQHLVYDDVDEQAVWLGEGKKGEAMAKAHMKGGVEAVIKKVYCDGGRYLITDHSSNEKGVCVNGTWIEPEELIEILRKCEEGEDD